MRKAVFDNLFGHFAMRRARALNQGDGLCQDGPLTAQDATDVLLTRKRPATIRDSRNQVMRRLRRHATGADTQRTLIRVCQSGSSPPPGCHLEYRELAVPRLESLCPARIHRQRRPDKGIRNLAAEYST